MVTKVIAKATAISTQMATGASTLTINSPLSSEMKKVMQNLKPKKVLKQQHTFQLRDEQSSLAVTQKEYRVAERFAKPFLEDIYSESISKAKLWRALKRVKKALRIVLKTNETPSDLN